MSEIIRKGSVFSLKQPFPILDNNTHFEIPAWTKGSILSPGIASGKRVVQIQLGIVAPSGTIVDLLMPADELISLFNRSRSIKDKILKDWGVGVYQSKKLNRYANIIYQGEVVASMHAVKDHGVVSIKFNETDTSSKAQENLKAVILSVNNELDAKQPILDEIKFFDYYFFNFYTFMSLVEYAQLLLTQRQNKNIYKP